MTLRRGKLEQANPLTIGQPRVLTREDLSLLKEKRPQKLIQTLRDPHHKLARLIAMGQTDAQAGAIAGYSMGSVQRLKVDPAFQQLIAEYRKIVLDSYKEQVDEYMELAVSNMVKSERMIAEHLDKADEDGELLPLSKLDTISQGRMDRFGYGKKQTNLNVNVDFAAQLEKARQRSGVAKVIEASPQPKLLRRA